MGKHINSTEVKITEEMTKQVGDGPVIRKKPRQNESFGSYASGPPIKLCLATTMT